jgi:DNA-directed RNA polymerase specialized sigma24 family protein
LACRSVYVVVTKQTRMSPGRRPDTVADDAFEGFYRRERLGVYRALALTLGDVDLASEAADEAMTRAYQRWRRLRSYDNPAGWAYRVGLNWAVSRIRDRRRTVPGEPTGDPTAPHEWAEPDERLERALTALSQRQRAVVVLRSTWIGPWTRLRTRWTCRPAP